MKPFCTLEVGVEEVVDPVIKPASVMSEDRPGGGTEERYGRVWKP